MNYCRIKQDIERNINEQINDLRKRFNDINNTASTAYLFPDTPNFENSEFWITGQKPSFEIQSKIFFNFSVKLQLIRDLYKKPICISENSGYRPILYEIKRGRSGQSEHTFTRQGAVDVVCNLELLELIIESKLFPRLIYYPHKGFCHLDYKGEVGKITTLWEMQEDNKTMIKKLSIDSKNKITLLKN